MMLRSLFQQFLLAPEVRIRGPPLHRGRPVRTLLISISTVLQKEKNVKHPLEHV
jgi:hypothetical protein